MKRFKDFLEEDGEAAGGVGGGGPTNVASGVCVGPNDIGVKLPKKKKEKSPVMFSITRKG